MCIRDSSCARCHDHKFDPIPTQDYYSIAGIFSSSRLNNAALCSPEDVKVYHDGQQLIKDTENAVKKYLADRKEAAATSKVPEIAKYMEAVWRFKVAKENGQAVPKSELAEAAEVNEFLLKRWIEFLDLKNKGKVAELAAWFELKVGQAGEIDLSKELPERVTAVTRGFQKLVESLVVVQDGVTVTNLSLIHI